MLRSTGEDLILANPEIEQTFHRMREKLGKHNNKWLKYRTILSFKPMKKGQRMKATYF